MDDKKKEELDKLAEVFALDHFLSEYPQDLEYNEVLRKIEDMDDDVLVWEPFENSDPSTLIEHIENLKESAQDLIKKALDSGADTPID